MADATLTQQEKAVSLFEFIRELNKLKQKPVLNMTAHPWCRTLSQLPRDPEHIQVFYRDRVEDDSLDLDHSPVLLSVRKPQFEPCPTPPPELDGWLLPGWDSFRADAGVLSFREDEVRDRMEYFSDDEGRLEHYEVWLEERSRWAQRQKDFAQTTNLFSELYRLYFDLLRDTETLEFVVANGVLLDRSDPELCHPVLTQRAKLRYDPDENAIYIEEVDAQSELYSIVFQTMNGINLDAINQLQDDLRRHDYHPLDRNETPGFLKSLVHQLSSDSVYSPAGVPENWKRQGRLLLYGEPCYILRKRLDGTPKAIERIIEHIQQTDFVPAPIGDIVSGGQVELPEKDRQDSIEDQLAAVGGESVDILLSKEANKEQLEIARRIEQYNAVLVQGPPGTGKTHTIANLMGHFLAQGKSVLVTSHTPKALNVLKDKVAPGLQNLCVSVLEDSNRDMERSIDGITDYMSRTTSHELRQEMDAIACDRELLMAELADLRKRLFEIIRQECGTIDYFGERLSPSQAASFLLEHEEDLSYIPGKVRLDTPLPLSFSQLAALYRSNGELSPADEVELAADLPAPEELLSPAAFQAALLGQENAWHRLDVINETSPWQVEDHADEYQITFSQGTRRFTTGHPRQEDVDLLRNYAASFGTIDEWMKRAAVDGKNGGAYRGRWETLIDQINSTCEYAEALVAEQFGQDIRFAPGVDIPGLAEPIVKLRDLLALNGRLVKLARKVSKDLDHALNSVTMGAHPIQTPEECDLVLHAIELERRRSLCKVYWNELMASCGVPRFEDLDLHDQERVARNWTDLITQYLNWYQDAYRPLLYRLGAVGIAPDTLFGVQPLDPDLTATDKILSTVSRDIPVICDGFSAILEIEVHARAIAGTKEKLLSGRRISSALCGSCLDALDAGDVDSYAAACTELARMHGKYALLRSRKEMLTALEPVAPQWADAIRRRKGIHGRAAVPDTIEEAWRWKQLNGIIADITAQPFAELQKESLRLSREYRSITARYAEKRAWYHLMKKTEGDIDMRHALQGWKQTVKKIGKGTGKNAPALKAKARELMSKCQAAVPGWIMPINRALESLDPKENRFDIIIIDEASQSDVSSLAILYMGQKLIIVGDDKQVSPMAVGVEVGKINALQQMYISGKIPNAHLYDAKTSIYDIAKTTFQPLMLREHFRCVPRIIGFSNELSYDHKIKPLRDASSSDLLPAVVSYRVEAGQRSGTKKLNPGEAKAIVALMRACMELPAYDGKTFGVISLLGDDQVKLIQQEIERGIDPRDIIGRSILCGNASNFQGDERDVVFLSLVDSAEANGPVHLQGFGVDDAYRKRYNVAVSRARDQLWVVHSLDPAIDLKPGDIRKALLDYAQDPGAREEGAEVPRADGSFECDVAQALVRRGYHVEMPWTVGAYRLDMVVQCGNHAVAVECDGERLSGGEAAIRADMERQTILERLGWHFLRIRGSEYFRDPERCMERVATELAQHGILPGSGAPSQTGPSLLDLVTTRAEALLAESET